MRNDLDLKQIRQGCLNFDFLVPENVSEELFKLCKEDKKEMSRQSIIITET